MGVLGVSLAFAFGLLARHSGLPPLVGFLLAGLALAAMGVEADPLLDRVADAGVTLLLFTIGLKLRVRSLLRPEVWLGASLHLLISVAAIGLAIRGLALYPGFGLLAGLDDRAILIVSFALAFSSTVFAAKVLEEKSELGSLHGRVAIGVLILQDVAAVAFLSASKGHLPSAWALLLPGLYGLRRAFGALMERAGHEELLILFGIGLALGGAQVFEMVGLEGGLGALCMGIVVAGQPKAHELARSLFGLKELLLVGFFLQVGLTASPSLAALSAAAAFCLLLPLKTFLYLLLFTRFRLRARTSLLASLGLASYSEFGLIVVAVAASAGWLPESAVLVVALSVSLSFIAGAPLNRIGHALYARLGRLLVRFESRDRHPDDLPIDVGDAEILIFGMGRIGSGAYDQMHRRYGDKVLGLDHDVRVVERNRAAGRRVIPGDATDSDFWERLHPGDVRLVMLAMPEHAANRYAARRLTASGYRGLVAATVRFPDEAEDLAQHGVHLSFHVLAEAGTGFADDVCERLGPELAAACSPGS